MPIRVSRRDLLAGFGTSVFATSSFACLVEAADRQGSLFASAYMDHKENYGVALLDEGGNILARYPIPGRGHGMAFSTTSDWVVAFARRPGNFALSIHVHSLEEPILFKSPSHTHFCGHGVFSWDGKLLFATENDFDSGQGRIGIYDTAKGFSRVGNVPSHGIGPHEIILMPDGRTLCVANGGILTHPDTGRTKLNLHDMQSSIAFIDGQHGDRVAKFNVPQTVRRLSLRHMAVDYQRSVWLGGQYEGDKFTAAPLIAVCSPDDGLNFLNGNLPHVASLSNYVGSVTCSADGKRVAFSSPRGNSLIIVDATEKTVLSQETVDRVCGVSPQQGGFATTSLSGQFNNRSQAVYWDNHLAGLKVS